ncbi:hypothetical protein KY334_05525 [Candidatus Woesearchaeota archaeon]|nr:hypothetical protein [Candidatus Woesearchaeota archaeon]
MIENQFIQIFIVGLAILIGAVIINVIANYLNITTWYSFLLNMKDAGFLNSIKSEGFNLIWLFVIYPLLLGLIGYYTTNLFS